MKLSKAWVESLKVTQPYRFQDKPQEQDGLNSYRNSGLRVDHDQIQQELQDIKLQEVYKSSVFNSQKRQPRGIKNGAIELEVSPRGGFRSTIDTTKEDMDQVLHRILLK